MYQVKVQLDSGDALEVAIAKLIIKGDGDKQIHLTATDEGVIVDAVADDGVVATCCIDPEVLTANCR